MITELDTGVLPTKYQGADVSVKEVMDPAAKAIVNPYTEGLPDAVAQKHAERYRQAFEMFLRHKKSIGRVTIWGLDDGDSWFNNFPVQGRTDYLLLFDRQFKPKPAYWAVLKTAQQDKPLSLTPSRFPKPLFRNRDGGETNTSGTGQFPRT